jgi:DNA recombination protein RmuC
MDPLVALVFVIGLAAGVAVGWTVARARALADRAALAARLEETTRQLERTERELGARGEALEAARREAAQLAEAHARVTSALEAERRAESEKLALIEQTREKLRETFRALSVEALQASLGELRTQAAQDLDRRHQALAALVEPIKDALGRVDARLHEVEQVRIQSGAQLAEQLNAVLAATRNLERALRAPGIRGRWGEIQLRRVVELAGMVERCDFFPQYSVATDEGRLTPDLLVKLPGGKHIIVDAKAPLEAYLQALEATDDQGRDEALKRHAQQVRDHIARLADREYWKHLQPAPEFVVMFLPGEAYFSAALQHDPGLIEFGAGRRVVPASPLTLIALLRAVAYGWQQERLAESAELISQLGRELYERIRRMADHFDDVAKGLKRAVDAYNSAVGALETRVLVTARKFRDLAVTATEELPQLEPVDRVPRALQAPEFADLLTPSPVVDGEAVPDSDKS